ncbi:PKD domain-containing protein [Methanoregula sp. UBA64]|jgi:PKD repeat protein|uniref:PKD domain-containing protein n=1 Tax=Methanoregula sp. UBA64 TaxID=1915554 RepID=UPI0025E2BE14|nr:PKD domain-containing protein [Methanoregula sp. UBA64]
MKIPLCAGCGLLLCLILVVPGFAATLPSVAFTSNVTEGTLPLGVLFVDESTNTPTAWLWSFGDGSTSTLQTPSHTYTTAGTYTVTLIASNAAGSATDTEEGYITVTKSGTVPVAAFVTNQTSGTVPFSIQFMDTSSNSPTAWLWSFGDGSSATTKNPVHTYTSAGTYSVTLTASNSAGSTTISQPGYITVTKEAAVPVASFLASGSSGEIPLTVQFFDASSNAPSSWVWSFGDGDYATSQNPSHTYTSAGSYTVTLTASNTAGSDTEVEEDCVVADPAKPVAAFVANITSGTVPLTVAFTDSSTNTPTAWYWSFGDGSTSSAQNVTHTYENTGSYSVTLTATNDEGSNTTTQSGFIAVSNAIGIPSASFTADTTTGSVPLAVQFTDTSSNTPTAWVWSFGDGASSTLPNPTHTYTAAGSFTVKLTASNTGGTDTVVRNGYITVTTTSPVTEAATPTAATTYPEMTETTDIPAAEAPAGSGDGSGILPYAGIAVLVAIGTTGYLLLKRPPRGPRSGGGRDL